VLKEKYWPNSETSDAPEGTAEPPSQIDNALFLPDKEYREIRYSLRRKKNIILQGAPGVGKTHVARHLALDVTKGDADRVTMVQFHQSYSYEDFVQGFRPTGDGGFERKDQVFWRFCDRARQDPENEHVFCIDEINRGNMSKIFGELLMLIESDKRRQKYAIPLTYSEESDSDFFVPENVLIIGMMNTADRSLSFVDYALRRRFLFFDLSPEFESATFRTHLESRGVEDSIISQIIEKMVIVNKSITEELGTGCQIGHSFFCPSTDDPSYDYSWYQNIVRREIQPLLMEYFVDNTDKVNELLEVLLPDENTNS
jgi:5-methylcytosine-specific restriction protein B